LELKMSETPNVEYTPYGETWIEKTSDYTNMLPYKFTAKELDDETGLYYYGARYLNPRTSRWISSDPAGSNLINPNRNGFSFIEANNWYSYVANNPIKFIDPTGNNLLTSIFKSRTSAVIQRLVSNPVSLGNADVNRSAYGRQYTTVNDHRQSMGKLLGVVGSIPTGLTQVLGWLGIAAGASEGAVSSEIVGYNQRKAFIAGAENEIGRIDNILSDGTLDSGFADFLGEQKGLLQVEVDSNKAYDSTESAGFEDTYKRIAPEGSGGRGGSIPPYRDTRTTTPPEGIKPIDYSEVYKRSQE